MIIETGGYRFDCSNGIERYRAESLFTKEEGTITWVLREAKAGDIFWDIVGHCGIGLDDDAPGGLGGVFDDFWRSNIPGTIAVGNIDVQRDLVAGRGLGLPRS